MKKIKSGLTSKVFFLIIATDVLESIAELFFKKAAAATGIPNVALHNFLEFSLRIFTLPALWVGILFYCLNFFLWIAVLSRADLSAAFPIGSTTYIIVPVLSMLFLKEKVLLLRWAGITLIIIGICFISKSTRVEHTH